MRMTGVAAIREIAVRQRLVTAAGAVHMARLMPATAMIGSIGTATGDATSDAWQPTNGLGEHGAERT